MSEVKTNKITSLASNNDITLDPDGTGDVVVASGNVMIGTTTEGFADYADTLTVADTDHAGITIRSGASSSGSLYFSDATSGSGEYDGYLNYNQSTQKLTVGTAAATRMTIDSSGQVGIGRSPATTLDVNGTVTITGTANRGLTIKSAQGGSGQNDADAVYDAQDTEGGGGGFHKFFVGGNEKARIENDGDIKNVNNSYGAISDQRMKENIVDAASQWDDIKAVQVRKFNMIGSDTTQIGVIAQELEAANMSGLVSEAGFTDDKLNPDGELRKTVKYSVLYMKAIGALQEAIAKIETLEAKVAALEAGE